jgi:hypothetical protein
VVALVSTAFPVPLGIRFQKNGESEVACALALLQDLVRPLGRRFLDVLLGDALSLQAPFAQAVEGLGLVWAFTLKENQPELLREAERFTQGSPAGVHTEPDCEIQYGHLPEVDWPVADRLVRVVKTVGMENRRRVTVSQKDNQRTKSKTVLTQPSTNFYATNFELGSVSPLFIHPFSRSRWRIHTEVFPTITTDCHLKHPAVHQTTALVVLSMIRFLAYTLSLVFYHRPVSVNGPPSAGRDVSCYLPRRSLTERGCCPIASHPKISTTEPFGQSLSSSQAGYNSRRLPCEHQTCSNSAGYHPGGGYLAESLTGYHRV